MHNNLGKNHPPPISFARRRAGQLGAGGKKKPADIVISPREAHTQEQLQPAIQSAPPVPQAGQGQFYTGRFPMTLPRLPPLMAGGDGTRRPIPGQVPPTPTRLSMQRSTVNPGHAIHSSSSGFQRRSPPPSVAIATTLVPPTPAWLHQPGYSGDKSAFLAPFGLFYDALNDSKVLKNWLGEQLQKSNQLVQNLSRQQERMDELVEGLVERKMVGVRDEMVGLHRRVEELEDALRIARAELVHRRQSEDVSPGFQVPTKHPPRNGAPHTHALHETYTFPPAPPHERRRAEPLRKQLSADGQSEKDRDSRSVPRSENSSPLSYGGTRRLSVSATRLDLPRVPGSTEHGLLSSSSSLTMLSANSQAHQGLASAPLSTLSKDRGLGLQSPPSVRAQTASLSLNSAPSNHVAPEPHPKVSQTPEVDRPGSPMDDDG
jgi:hypothetical protein